MTQHVNLQRIGKGLSVLLCVMLILGVSSTAVQAGYTGPQRTPAATVSISVQCSYHNGWCSNAGNVVITGYDPLYSIIAIEGSINGGGFNCSGSSCSLPLSDGFNRIVAWAVSSYGDTSDMRSLSVGVDSVGPKINFSVPNPTGENGWHIKPLQVRVSGTDIGSGIARAQISLGGQVWENDVLQINRDGRYHVIGLVSDYAGNTARESVWVKMDVTPPEATLKISEPDGENGWFVKPAFISISGSDSYSGAKDARILINGEYIPQRDEKSSPVLDEWTDKAALRSRYVPGNILSAVALVRQNGIHEVTAIVTDEAGNLTEKSTLIHIDAQPPQIDYIPPASIKDVITLSGAVVDPLSGIRELLIDFGRGWEPVPLSSSAWQVDVNTKALKLDDGVYSFNARAVDMAGNISTISKRFTVFNNTWPFFTIMALAIGLAIGYWADPRNTAWQNLAASAARLRAVSIPYGGEDD